jgi:uncharacterized LabA/DUF88 family protein
MLKRENNFAFIDSQNLNLSIQECGWLLDFKRFYFYLQHKYHVNKTFLFIGYISENKKLYSYLKKIGYILIHKPVLSPSSGFVKGNIDAELVLHAMIEFPNYDKAMIVSGDGDFYCLIEYLLNKHKLYKVFIPNQKKYSSLLRKYYKYFVFGNNLKKKLEKEKSIKNDGSS